MWSSEPTIKNGEFSEKSLQEGVKFKIKKE